MKHTLILVAAVLTACTLTLSSCENKYPAEKEAVAAKITEMKGEVKHLKFNNFEQIGQTTVGEEIEMRVNQFKTKLEQDQKFLDMYTAGGVLGKASRKKIAVERDQLHLTQLDSIRNSLGEGLNAIAYKDYKFSAVGKLADGKLEATDWYAAISPDGKVLNLVEDVKKLHKGLGSTIPGYKAMFDE